MVKMFLSAVVSGGFFFNAMTLFDPGALEYIQSQKYSIMKRGFIPSVVGGLLLGFGLALSGACPGIVLIQVGMRIPYAIYTLIGCYLGTFIYEYFESRNSIV